MPSFYLFIATLVIATTLLPVRILHRVRTMRTWLNQRQEKREQESLRQYEIHEAWHNLVSRVGTTVRQLRNRPNKTDWEHLLVQLKAEGERYLKLVNHDDQPPIHRFAQKLIRDIDKEMNNSAVRHNNR